MTTKRQPDVALLDAAAGQDAALVDRLTELVNRVYAIAESGLWRDGMTRTTPSEMTELIAAQEIAVATADGEIAGCIRMHDVSEDTSEFGILVSAPEHRGTGIGRALLDFAEQHSRRRGQRAMQLELLVPRDWSHPSKEFLKRWYGHRGYRLVRTTSLDESYPHLTPLLATPCDLEIHAKPLMGR
jgi:GNAT superfamily N-acetyltransferase